MAQAEVPAIETGALGERVEELDALANGGDLLRIVELEAKGAGRRRRGQRSQRRTAFEDHHPQAGAGSEEGGRAADHPAADHDDVGLRGRRIGEAHGRRGHGRHASG